MRLWSFNPKYLDSVGLSRAINEAISGYKALTGKQKMWQNHSQLERFKNADIFVSKKDNHILLQSYIVSLITNYRRRKYKEIDFSQSIEIDGSASLTVTKGQIEYEWQHYLNKLKTQKGRDKELYEQLKDIKTPEPHPLFSMVAGDIESWEKVK